MWGGGFHAKRAAAADKLHWSDCAVHNGPAYPAGECDCGAAQDGKCKLCVDGCAACDARAQPAQEPVALRDALAGALTSTYVCGRVWSAWNVGTMTENDFQPAAECNELLDELVRVVATAAHGIGDKE